MMRHSALVPRGDAAIDVVGRPARGVASILELLKSKIDIISRFFSRISFDGVTHNRDERGEKARRHRLSCGKYRQPRDVTRRSTCSKGGRRGREHRENHGKIDIASRRLVYSRTACARRRLQIGHGERPHFLRTRGHVPAGRTI